MSSDFDGIADFRFVRLLGSGSFANTFEAEHGGERFAVKVFHDLPLTQEARERFRREVSSLRIEHPNLAEYVDSGVAPSGGRAEVAFIAMRYVPGRSLRQELTQLGGQMASERAAGIAQGIAAGLRCLHDRGVVHRDLKPANVYLPSGGGVVILDFGLAHVQDLTTITARGAFVGTLAYSAPEQIRGEADVHSDLYALGAILFEMLTGQIPFPANNELELIERIRHEDPEPPVAIEPSVPKWLDQLVLDLLAKEPLQRPRGAQAVVDAFRDPVRHGTAAVRAPYDRNAAPLLIVRATGTSPAKAIMNMALQGAGPDGAIAAITQPGQLEELHRARAMAGFGLAIDTRVPDTATSRFQSIAALRDRRFLPAGLEPHTPISLRAPGEMQRVARGDIAEQLDEGADLLRAPGFIIDSAESGWLRRNPRLLEVALAARDVFAPALPLYASVLCTADALARQDARLSIVNRFARGTPDGYWFGLPDAGICTAQQLAATLDFVLLLEQLGAPCVWALPGELAEMAWSLGVAGIEITLGRIGGFRLRATGQVRRIDPAPRFEFSSIMTSLAADAAEQALSRGDLPESDCPCPSCRRSTSVRDKVAHADDHNLWTWMHLRDALVALDAEQRIERYRLRLEAANKQLAIARKQMPALRSLRHLSVADGTLTVVLDEGILDTTRRLRRAS